MSNKKNVYGVILAGGKGERLWPLSREKTPKQFLSLNQKTLLSHTIDRIRSCINQDMISIVTTEQHADLVRSLCNTAHALIIEPYSRNTGPALLLSCLTIAAQDPSALVAFFPADHHIQDTKKFGAVLAQALHNSLSNSTITLIGVKPTFPATGYGYIEYDVAQVEYYSKIVRFHEKPTLVNAQHYCQLPNMVWNIGVFCAQVTVFIEEYKKLAPDMYQDVVNYFETGDSALYQDIESISVDYAIMEKSDRLDVIPGDFDWSDIGNLSTFLSLQSLQDNQRKPLEINASNNLVTTDLLTVLIGVDDLCIVKTNDVLLIAKRDEVEKVKLAVNELRKNNLKNYL